MLYLLCFHCFASFWGVGVDLIDLDFHFMVFLSFLLLLFFFLSLLLFSSFLCFWNSHFLYSFLNNFINVCVFSAKAWFGRKKLFSSLTGVAFSNSLHHNMLTTVWHVLFVAGSVQSPGPHWSVYGSVCEEDTNWPGRGCQRAGQPGPLPAQWLF